ncbi:hypothetical protein ACIO87_23245 [Streptomyces sp. NPDC087218]
MSEDISNEPIDLAQDLAIEDLTDEAGTTAVSTFSTVGCSSSNTA